MTKPNRLTNRRGSNPKKPTIGKTAANGGEPTGAADLTSAGGAAPSASNATQSFPTDQEQPADLPPTTTLAPEGEGAAEPGHHAPAPPTDAGAIQQPTAGLAAPDDAGPAEERASEATIAPVDLVWQAIAVGAVVLAQVSPAEGWWEARVTGALGNVLTLQWRDYPSYPPLSRSRSEVALIYPEAR